MPYTLDKRKSNLFRERPWVFIYGSLLAGCAGYINVLMLGIYHVPVSHMSGATSRLAMDLSTNNMQDFHGALGFLPDFLLVRFQAGHSLAAPRCCPVGATVLP